MAKTALQLIADAVAKKHKITVKEAEKFVSAMFDVVNEGLKNDKLVKVKGLGTFKVQAVKPRESVNVNTGERVLIEGHNKVSFTPDASMKDGLMDVIILEPFSILEAPIVAMQLFQRTLPHNSHVKTFRTNRLLIERTTAVPAHCDGDPYETTARIKVELVPAGLRAIINEKALLTPPTSSVQSNMMFRTLEPFQKQMVNLRNQVNSLFDIF